ncbi:MAG TPA: hypothetical protein DIW67_11140 [Pseudomonas sp.]|nr:hypothetical protein [Pseudomonas sp.]
MIRIDSIWLATEPMDMRAGTETALARVIAVFGAAQPHCAYLFANRRANRMKVLVHASQRQTDVGRDGTWRVTYGSGATEKLWSRLGLVSILDTINRLKRIA